MSSLQTVLANPPVDGVSRVRFASAETVLAASWDTHVYLYDTGTNALRSRYAHRAAVLDVAPLGAGECASAGVDRELVLHDWPTGTSRLVGMHDGPVRCVEALPGGRGLLTGSWDRTLRLWDVRTAEGCQGVFEQPDKVFAMAITERHGNPLVVVATAGRHVLLLDPRQLGQPLQRRESSLKTQTRCVAASPSGEFYAVGSVDGRVAMEYVDPLPDAQVKKYAFKCHRSTGDDGFDIAHPVNVLGFHPVHGGTFASGGCDGVVNVWDGANKKRLCQWTDYPTAIASFAFAPDGRRVVVAASYTFEEGNRPHAQDALYLREVGEREFVPKSKAAKLPSRSAAVA
ncbi:budding uninhibited by benzimidazoles 3-like protein, isoform CRA_b [Pavlovales sp. CCMP2436]|nr:budding uninhibited by benzimidazoles 3-like protein, isoform CRA_b [Pavlovales sp. CCMP2436]